MKRWAAKSQSEFSLSLPVSARDSSPTTTRVNHTVYGPLGGGTSSTFTREYEKHTGDESWEERPELTQDPEGNTIPTGEYFHRHEKELYDLDTQTNNHTTTGQEHNLDILTDDQYGTDTHVETTTDLFETQPAPTPPPAAPSFAGQHAPNEAGGGEGEGKPKPPLAIEPSDELILELQHQRAMENMPAPDDPGWVEKIPGFTPSNRKPTPEQERALAEWEAEGMASERMRRSANFDDFFWHSGVSNHMNALQGAMNTVMEAEAVAFGFVAPGGDDLDHLATSLGHVFAGQFKEAAKSAVSMIPYLGDAIRKGGKFLKYGARYGDEAVAVAKPTAVPVAETVGPSKGGFSGRKGFELKNHPGQIVRNQPATINGRQFSGHALDQMQNRGIPPSVVENTIKHGQKLPGKYARTQEYFDPVNRIRVIVSSQTGDVITVIPGVP